MARASTDSDSSGALASASVPLAVLEKSFQADHFPHCGLLRTRYLLGNLPHNKKTFAATPTDPLSLRQHHHAYVPALAGRHEQHPAKTPGLVRARSS
jgi:hypothetical protein